VSEQKASKNTIRGEIRIEIEIVIENRISVLLVGGFQIHGMGTGELIL
jgi:hypothetical protein